MPTGVMTKGFHNTLGAVANATLYTVPTGKYYYADIWLKNNGAGNNTVTLKLDDGTTNLQLWGQVMATGDETVIRNVKAIGDEIFKGSATNASEVACRIVGILETP